MISILDFLDAITLRDFVMVYAALVSTVIAVVQIRNANSDRPCLRVRLLHRNADKLGYAVAEIANKGRKPVSIFPPELEVVEFGKHGDRAYYRMADGIEENNNWVRLDEYGPQPEPFELKELQREFFRFQVTPGDALLRVKIVDRIGDVRATKRFVTSLPVRLYAYGKLAVRWARGRMRVRGSAA